MARRTILIHACQTAGVPYAVAFIERVDTLVSKNIEIEYGERDQPVIEDGVITSKTYVTIKEKGQDKEICLRGERVRSRFYLHDRGRFEVTPEWVGAMNFTVSVNRAIELPSGVEQSGAPKPLTVVYCPNAVYRRIIEFAHGRGLLWNRRFGRIYPCNLRQVSFPISEPRHRERLPHETPHLLPALGWLDLAEENTRFLDNWHRIVREIEEEFDCRIDETVIRKVA